MARFRVGLRAAAGRPYNSIMTQKIESGGRYEIDPKTGVRTLVEEPTKQADGTGARDSEGKPVPPHGTSAGGEQ